MKHIPLNRLSAGFTDLFIVKAADFAASVTAAGEADSVVLCALAAGDMLFNGLLETRTAAAGLTAASGAVELSVAGGLFGADDLLTGADGYFSLAASDVPRLALAAQNLQFTLTPNQDEGDEQAVADITDGEFWIWLSISRKADRNVQA